jgi:hypothetical protein
MVARLGGALAAIAAAALLVAGVVTSAWWTGHGDKGGGTDVSIGLREAQRCFVRHEANGKPRCTATTTTDCDSSEEYHCDSKGTTAVSTAFGTMGWGATVLGALAALLLAIAGGIASSRGREEAKGAAGAGATIAMIAGAAGVAFVLMRPTLTGFDVDLAWSAYAFWGGAVAAAASAALLRREERVAPVVVHAPRERRSSEQPWLTPRLKSVDFAAMLDEEAQQASAKSAAAALAGLDEPEPPLAPPGDRTDPDMARPPAPSPPLVPATRVASENRADTEKDLPPDDMQGTPAPVVKPASLPPSIAPPPPRPKPASLPPLPLPRTKPPSLPPPVRPPATPSGTGPSPRIAAPEASIARPAAPPPTASPAGPVPACPQCDAPTVWNEEHLRFFCRSCRIYL